MKQTFITSLVLFFAITASGQSRPALPPPTDLVAREIPGVVAGGTRIELVKAGFRRTEGPVGMPDGSLLFTETDSITRIDAAGNTSTFVEHSNGSNGLGFDSKGRLISVQRAAGNERVGVLYPPGSVTVLADNYGGTAFSRLNDLVVSKRDSVFFADGKGLYYLPPGGKAIKAADGIPNPNGVLLSPDERVLYANDKDGEYLLAFDVKPDGTLINRRNFGKYQSLKVAGHKDPLVAEDNGADGLAVDNAGRVYVATNLGVEVFSPQGQHLGIIPVVWGGETFNLKKPQNLAFAGPDRKTLYTVGAGAVFKIRMLTEGVKGRAK